MNRFLTSLFRNTRGATAIEYGLICALIVIAVIGAMQGLGGQSGGMWGSISSKTATAMSGAAG
jgi:pilus assembly protein Flp/PilA